MLFTLLFAVAARWFMRKFTSDLQVLGIGSRMICLAAVSLPFMALQTTFTTYLQATGQAAKAIVVNLSRQCLILIPVITLMNYLFNLDGFLLAQPVSDIATTVLAVSLVLPGILKLARQRNGGM
jgi:Na+-driven multidrug efflux pump